MAKEKKTNAMRILDKKGIDYKIFTYESEDGQIDGISVAKKIDQPVEIVYKTLVTQGTSKQYYVMVIPVAKELDLKKSAKAVDEKKVELIAVKDLLKLTGYVRGGCSPVGMKKQYVTVVDQDAEALATIVVSAGKIGCQVQVSVSDLIATASAKVASIT